MIFTLIEVKDGGAVNSRDWGSGFIDSNVRISSWVETDYKHWTDVIGRKVFEEEYGLYEFDRFTILINGIHVNQTSADDIWDHYYYPTPDGVVSEIDAQHDIFVEKFWEDVMTAKHQYLAEHRKKLADKKAEDDLRQAELKRLSILKQEEADRLKFEELKLKFGK